MENSRTCPWCGKACHLSRTAALRSARRRGGRSRHEVRLRAYLCPAGQGWHLTSRKPRRRNRRPQRTGRPGRAQSTGAP